MNRAEGTRNQILETAVKIAGTEGLRGLTIGMLARAVGMSKSGLFAHFNSKENLQLMVFKMAADDFKEKVFSISFREPRGEPRVRAILYNWIQYMKNGEVLPGANVLIAAATEMDSQPEALREFVKRSKLDLIANLERAAKIAVDEGHFRSDLNLSQFAWGLYSIVLGFYHFSRLMNENEVDAHVEQAFENLMLVSRAEG